MSDESNSQKLEQRFRHMKVLDVLLCIMLGLLTLAICYFSVVIGAKILNGAEGGFVAVIVALFDILITGVFVFMTFRLDRGPQSKLA